MADDENSVPVSIGFSATAIVSTCAKCRVWQVYIRKRKYPVSESGFLVTGSRIFGQEQAAVTGFGMDHSPRYHSSQPGWTRENVLSGQTTQAISKGYRKNPGGGGGQRPFIHWNRAIKDIMRSHISKWIDETVKKAYTRADRDQEDRVTAHEVRALSGIMGLQLSGGSTWHSVSGVLDGGRQESSRIPICAIWPELLMGCLHGNHTEALNLHAAQQESFCMVTCSGRSTCSGSRTSSPTSIAYTICMQPLLRHA